MLTSLLVDRNYSFFSKQSQEMNSAGVYKVLSMVTWRPCVLCTLRAAALRSVLVHFGGQAQTHARQLVLVLGLRCLLILGDNPTVQVLLIFYE